jgi:hypothetical protein
MGGGPFTRVEGIRPHMGIAREPYGGDGGTIFAEYTRYFYVGKGNLAATEKHGPKVILTGRKKTWSIAFVDRKLPIFNRLQSYFNYRPQEKDFVWALLAAPQQLKSLNQFS